MEGKLQGGKKEKKTSSRKQVRHHLNVMLLGDKFPAPFRTLHSNMVYPHWVPGLSNTPCPIKVNQVN